MGGERGRRKRDGNKRGEGREGMVTVVDTGGVGGVLIFKNYSKNF